MIVLSIAAYFVVVICVLLVGAVLLFDIVDCNYINTFKEKSWVTLCATTVIVVGVVSLYIVYRGVFS